MAGTKTDEERRLGRGPSHVEDPTIEQLAEEAAHTDDVAVQRTLFGWRELVSTLIPLVLIAFAARGVDWDEAGRALARSRAPEVALALAVYYATFPLRSWRWARLLRTGGATVDWRDLLRILFLGWFVNCIVPAKLGDLYRSYLVKQRFGVSLSRTVGVVVAERLLDLLVVFVLLIVGGYVAFGRTIVPDLRVVYLTGAALGLVIVGGLAGIYFVGPRIARFFPGEVRRIGRLFREGV
ncbi:MAG TPA: lysylphosphatidylglycerol synthase transmembrane domain-containing protein, partial [Candidatus Limnocylindria bacterium]|nr:lysylphosphatidylglycerol synthase transmembrane domain-containing protein [Candidatus Limnocylindria bacterium]